MANFQCTGEHRYFVADVAVVEYEGKVCPIIVCTACGDAKRLEFSVTDPGTPFFTKKTKETNNEPL